MSNYLSQSYKLEKKVVLITGSSGQIGTELCRAFKKMGSIVVGIDIVEPKKELKDLIFFKKDITNKKDISALFNELRNTFDSIDILVNNAGVSIFTPYHDRSKEELDFVLDTNIKGSFYFIQEFIEFQKSKKHIERSIVNVSSMYGLISPDFRIYNQGDRKNSEIYGATKAGIIQLTKYFAVHLAENNIRVNSISPGGVYNSDNPQSESFIKNYSYRCPMKRMAKVEEISGAVVFLSSSASSYITGQNLVIDGGMSCW